MKTTFVFILMALLSVSVVSCDKKGSAVEELRARGIIQNELTINEPDEKGLTALHNAILQGNKECTRLLIDAGADINVQGPGGMSPLALAIRKGQKDVVEAMLKGKPKVKGAQPLTEAIMHDMPEYVAPLLEAGAWMDPCDSKVLTPLLASILKKDKESFRLVLKACLMEGKGVVDVSSEYFYHGRDGNYLTPLTLAMDLGLDDMVDALLEAGANTKRIGVDLCYPVELAVRQKRVKYVKQLLPHCKDDKKICARALVEAAKQEDASCLKLLLETDCLDAKDDLFKRPPLVELVREAPVKNIELVLKRKVDVNAADKFGGTALYEAIRAGRADVVALLLKHGADPNTKDKSGSTVLRSALSPANPRFDCAEHLLRAGADINALGKSRETLLEQAVAHDNLALAEYLLKHKANPDVVTYIGEPLLQVAMRKKDTQVLELLLKHGANPNVPDSFGKPLLQAVLTDGKLELAEMLIKAGADVNAKDKDGSPIINGLLLSKEAIILLLRHGADLNATNKNGDNVLKYNKYNFRFTEALESIVK